MFVSDVSERCNRRVLSSKPLVVGLLFVSVPSSSSAIGNVVDFAPGVTDGAEVGNNDLLGDCLQIIGDSTSSGKCLNLTMLFLFTLVYLGESLGD